MADGTVRGAFHLEGEQPIRVLTTIRTRGREANTAMKDLGRSMDTLTTKTTAAWGQMERTVDTHAARIEGRLDRLEGKLRDIGRINATPTVDLGGFDRVNAQLTELELRLNRLGAQRASPSVGLGGGFADGGGGGASTVAGGGGGGSRTFSSLGGIGGRLPWWAALIPMAPGLLGGATALAGSATSAALGAGTVGLGGAAALGVGGGLSALAFKPAIAGLQQVAKAQTAYNKAVQEFGRQSTQAATAQRNLNQAIVSNPAAAGASRQLTMLRHEWQTAAAPARAQAYRGISGVLYNARRAAPSIAQDTGIAANATANAAISYSGFLTQNQSLTAARTLTTAFASELPIAERSLQNITSTFEHLSVAAIPFFHEANVWVEHWSSGVAKSSSNTAQVQSKMQGYVNSAKDWARLTGAAFRTIRDIFSAGTPAGDSMVVQLTHTLDRWDSWINRNPAKVSSFFSNAARETGTIASTIARAAKTVWQLLQSIAPIVDRIVQALGLVSGLGPGGIGLAGAAIYGAYGGLRGATGGRLPSGGALTRSYILGGAGPGVAARSGGGMMVGGTAAASALGRASNLEVARGQTAGGMFLMGGATSGTAAVLERRAAAAAAQETGWLRSRVNALVARSPVAAGAADLAGGLGRAGRSVLGGAARFALPMLAINALLGGIQPTQGGGLAAHIQNAGSALTLGVLAPYVSPQTQGSTAAQTFMGGITTTNPVRVAHQIGARIASLRPRVTHLDAFGQIPVGTLMPASVAQGGTGPGSQRIDPQALAEIKALTPAYQQAQEAAKQYRAAQAAAFDQKSIARAHHYTGELASVFAIFSKHEGPAQAVKNTAADMLLRLKGLSEHGRKVLGDGVLAWAAQIKKHHPAMTGEVDAITRDIVRKFNDLGQNIQIVNGRILDGSKSEWNGISRAMSDPVELAKERMSAAFTAIQQQAIGSLIAMGYSRPQARSLVTAVESSSTHNMPLTSQAGALGQVLNPTTGKKRARGGVVSGTGLLDTVRTPDGGLAAPGEAWIANRHTMNDLSSATLAKFGKTAWQMIRDEGRLHSAPMRARGGHMQGMAPVSGMSSSVSSSHPELHAGIASAVQDVLSRFPLSITSTTSGGHASGSYHYLGEAADISGDPSLMLRAASWIKSSGLARSLTEGIHNPNLSYKFGQPVSPSYWGSTTWGEHLNHIHMAVAGALGGGPGAFGGGARQGLLPNVHLRAPRSGLGGVPGALADQGSRIYARGLQRKLNAAIGASGGISAAGFHGGGSSGANQALGKRMMLAEGWPASEWPSLRALWTQESGWDANAVNSSSGAAGIPQALGHGHPFNLGDAPAQIAWGLNYIKGRYGSPSAAEAHERSAGWYSRGGNPRWGGWHGKGTDFTTKGPTVIGVGEVPGRRERVTVGPAHSPTSGGGARIQVIMQNVHLNGGSAQDVERVATEVAGKILDALDSAGVGGADSELIGAGS